MDDDLLEENKELDPEVLDEVDTGAGLDDDLGDETIKAEVEEEEEEGWGSD